MFNVLNYWKSMDNLDKMDNTPYYYLFCNIQTLSKISKFLYFTIQNIQNIRIQTKPMHRRIPIFQKLLLNLEVNLRRFLGGKQNER